MLRRSRCRPPTTLASLRERIRSRPDYLFAREDGVYQAAVFLQTLEDHGPALSFEQAGEIYPGHGARRNRPSAQA